tara:strand:- start:11 stop:445 length:435 start_codon:yes stop_codon:yes gene_type:complete
MTIQLEDINNVEIQRKKINDFIKDLDDYINEESIFYYYYKDRKYDMNLILKTLKNENNNIEKEISVSFFNKLFNEKFSSKKRKILSDSKIKELRDKQKNIENELKLIKKELKINEIYIRQIELDIKKLKRIKREKIRERNNLKI